MGMWKVSTKGLNGKRSISATIYMSLVANSLLSVSFCFFLYAGLAHFAEHMLFMGTEKYPDENQFSAYLNVRRTTYISLYHLQFIIMESV